MRYSPVRRYGLPLISCVLALWAARPVQAASKVVFVQPIQVRDNAGANPANAGRQLFQDSTEKIFAQADVQVKFLPFNTFDDTPSLAIANAAQFAALLDTAGHGQHPTAAVIDMWFVNTLYSDNDENTTLGRARRPGHLLAIADSSFTTPSLDVFAHEIGHNFGLAHDLTAGSLNLMAPTTQNPNGLGNITPDGLALDTLNAAQIATIKGSNLLKPVIDSVWKLQLNSQAPWGDKFDWVNTPNIAAFPNIDPSVGVFNVDTNFGSIFLDQSVNVEKYRQAGGTVSTVQGFTQKAAANLTVDRALTWTGGNMNGLGTTFANGGLTMQGTVTLNGGRVLTNAGDATLAGGGLIGGNKSVFNNLEGARFEVTDNSTVDSLSTGANVPIFNNDGTFRKRGGAASGATTVTWVFNNKGTVLVNAGTLQISGGGGGTGGFFVGPGTKLGFFKDYNAGDVVGDGAVEVKRGTVNFNASYDLNFGRLNSGSTTVAGATALFNAQVTSLGAKLTLTDSASGTPGFAKFAKPAAVPTLSMSSSNGNSPKLEVGGDFTVNDSFDWQGGTLTGNGKTIAEKQLMIGNRVTLDARTLVNAKAATVKGAATVFGENGAVIENRTGATFVLDNNATFTTTVGAAPTFQNAGTFTKGGAGTTDFKWKFENTGTVEGKSGTLNFSTSYLQTAGLLQAFQGAVIASPNALDVTGGRIGGDGRISAPNVRNNAIIGAGKSPGDLTIDGSLIQGPSAILESQLAGLDQGINYDFIDVNGATELNGTLTVMLLGGFRPVSTAHDLWTLLTADVPITGEFLNVENGGRLFADSGFGSFQVNYGAHSFFDPQSVILSDFVLNPSAVPLPAGLQLLGVGLVALLRVSRRRSGALSEYFIVPV